MHTSHILHGIITPTSCTYIHWGKGNSYTYLFLLALAAEALLRLGRTDDAWEVMQRAAAKGLPDIAERFKFTHVTRVATVHLRRGLYLRTKSPGAYPFCVCVMRQILHFTLFNWWFVYILVSLSWESDYPFTSYKWWLVYILVSLSWESDHPFTSYK